MVKVAGVAVASPLVERRPVFLAAIFAVFVLLTFGTTPAHADDKTAARDHWERGTKFYDLGKYDDAIREFEAAYEAKSDPAFLYNLAQSHRLAGHPNDALRFYRTYLRYVPKAPNRADIEQHIQDLEKLSADHPATEPVAAMPPPMAPGSLSPPVVTAPPPASVPPPAAPPPPQAPNVAWPPADTTNPAGGAPNSYPNGSYPNAVPPTMQGTAPGSTIPPPSTQPAVAAPGSGRKTTGIVIAASGGGVFVVGAIFGLVARNQSKKVETAASNNQRFDPSVESLGKTSQTLQWVGYGVGIAALATGLVLYATAPATTESVPPGHVAFAPVISRGAGGALVRVTF